MAIRRSLPAPIAGLRELPYEQHPPNIAPRAAGIRAAALAVVLFAIIRRQPATIRPGALTKKGKDCRPLYVFANSGTARLNVAQNQNNTIYQTWWESEHK